MKTFKELVYKNIGTASMCWSDNPKGVFDSCKAKELGYEIIEEHKREMLEIKSILMRSYEENVKLRESLEFYADEDNWCSADTLRSKDLHKGYSIRTNCVMDGSIPRGFKDDNDMWRIGGRRARQTLKEIGEK